MGNPLYGSNKADSKLDGMVDAQDAIADAAAVTFAAGSIDTGTDMTAAEAAKIVADLGELRTKLNLVIAALEGAGVIKT